MQNNKMNVEAMIEMTKVYVTNDAESLKIASEMINECADVTGENRLFNLAF